MACMQRETETVDTVIDRISSHLGVEGVILLDGKDQVLRTTLDNTNTLLFTKKLGTVASQARSLVRDIDPKDDLMYLRIGSTKLEFMARLDSEFTAIVLQSRVKKQQRRFMPF